jgi:hypothetical protein
VGSGEGQGFLLETESLVPMLFSRVVTLCGLVSSYQCFGKIYCLHLQGEVGSGEDQGFLLETESLVSMLLSRTVTPCGLVSRY